ncbi:MAG: cytochrome c oxidase subunit I [Gemmobacter sp.]|nr:cytochrome c oxidase subunit I [Gemmobacter sp.]
MSPLRRHRQLTRIWQSDPGWKGWFTTVNHNDLGRMFMGTAIVFFLIGGILAMLIRAQLATPRSAFMGPEVYAQVFTMHGTIMMFLFAIPLIEGAAIYFLPKMLGARDLAFPRLTAFGYWCYVFGGSMLLFAMFAGIAPDSGWFLYPPLSSTLGSPGINSDFWLIGITFVEISAISAAVEITVTILRYRAPGMSLDKMPIFAWYLLVVALMILTGFPPLILGSVLLELERAFGWPFFQVAQGGDSLLWQHLFWLFGHPEVYIIFLPAAGVISTVLPVMARTTLLGYAWVIAAAVALGVLSFGIWVHHMFATGIPHMALAFFSAASTLVAVPTGIQIFAWLGTLWKGRPQLKLPMLWIIGFFATFVIGGLTGVMVAVVPFDWQAHDTHFVVAHMHYVLVGGFVFPFLAGLYYWMPLLTGRKRFFRLGETAFWLVFVGFHVTFLAMHWVGLLGQRRRTFTYEGGHGWEVINLISSIGGFITAIGFGLVIIDIAVNTVFAARIRRDPWRAGTLEWAMANPSPAYNFASLPRVSARDPLYDDPALPHRIARGEGYLGDAYKGQRETLVVDIATGEPLQVVVFPPNTPLPIILAFVTGGIFLGLLTKLYWMVPLSLIGVAALMALWAWGLGSRGDDVMRDVGHGLNLPRAATVPQPPGWWGSAFLLLADATFFASLIFGYAFLWTVAPNWPPPAYLEPGIIGPLVGLAGVVVAPFGIRLAERHLRRGGTMWPGVALALAGAAAMATAAIMAVRAAADPELHAYDAIIWVIAGYVLVHVALAAGMSIYATVRRYAGYVAPDRFGEVRIARLWTDYASVVALIGLAALQLPGAVT